MDIGKEPAVRPFLKVFCGILARSAERPKATLDGAAEALPVDFWSTKFHCDFERMDSAGRLLYCAFEVLAAVGEN